MPREPLTADELYAILEREFLLARATECVTLCRVPPVVFREAPADDEANWEIPTPMSCPRQCHRLMMEAFAWVAGRYNMRQSETQHA